MGLHLVDDLLEAYCICKMKRTSSKGVEVQVKIVKCSGPLFPGESGRTRPMLFSV